MGLGWNDFDLNNVWNDIQSWFTDPKTALEKAQAVSGPAQQAGGTLLYDRREQIRAANAARAERVAAKRVAEDRAVAASVSNRRSSSVQSERAGLLPTLLGGAKALTGGTMATNLEDRVKLANARPLSTTQTLMGG
jgi:hypothetical protein